MKGVVLAGGLGTRLLPLTKVTNKHLLPIYNKPMIYYPIETLVRAGIKEILIVTGGNSAGEFLKLLGNGKEFGLKHLNYTYQEGEGGIAEALGLAEHFADDEPVVVILGDNIFEGDIKGAVESFRKQGRGAKILLKEVENPERFGVAELEGDRIVRIEEMNRADEHGCLGCRHRTIYTCAERRFACIRAPPCTQNHNGLPRNTAPATFSPSP